MSRNVISIICSVIAWIVILLLTGVFGPLAFAIGLVILKVIGSVILLGVLIRTPIVLMEREDSKSMKKLQTRLRESAQVSLTEVANGVKRASINMVGRDNPLMPPDYDE